MTSRPILRLKIGAEVPETMPVRGPERAREAPPEPEAVKVPSKTAAPVQHDVRADAAEIRKRWPMQPYAVGIGGEMRVGLGWSAKRFGRAMALVVRSTSYLGALAAEGSVRFGLDGSAVGPVDDGHRAFAAEWLARRDAKATKPPKRAASLI